MRQDIDWQDVPFLLAGVISPGNSIGLQRQQRQWRINVRFLLDGLRQQRVPTARNAEPGHHSCSHGG
ncbi:MAG: hypothetical protein ACRDL5_16425 [Solirubrobacteraceae bacterium]